MLIYPESLMICLRARQNCVAFMYVAEGAQQIMVEAHNAWQNDAFEPRLFPRFTQFQFQLGTLVTTTLEFAYKHAFKPWTATVMRHYDQACDI